MSDEGVKNGHTAGKPASTALSESFLGVCLLLVAIASAITVLFVPRGVVPHELPPLLLSPRATADVLRQDDEDARHAPTDVHAEALITLIHAQGEAEATPGESPDEAARREWNLRAVVNDVRASSGEIAFRRLRALAVKELVEVLAHRENNLASDRVLGSFPTILERYGLTERGRLRAPLFVVRALYKARWNSICRFDPTFALAPVEVRAFYGWLALSAHQAPIAERIAALMNYRRHGGVRSEEALATLLHAAHEEDRAAEHFLALYAASGNVRFRNYARALQVTP